MNKFLIVCVLLLGSSVAASAQGSAVEAFGGYSFLHITDNGASGNGNGAVGSVAVRVLPLVSVVGEFSYYHFGTDFGTGNVSNYLFGPKVSASAGRLKPFAQVLFGGSHASGNADDETGSENAFAMAIGGGADYNVAPFFAIRLAQAEYVLTKFNDGLNNRQNNFRYSAGVVFHF